MHPSTHISNRKGSRHSTRFQKFSGQQIGTAPFVRWQRFHRSKDTERRIVHVVVGVYAGDANLRNLDEICGVPMQLTYSHSAKMFLPPLLALSFRRGQLTVLKLFSLLGTSGGTGTKPTKFLVGFMLPLENAPVCGRLAVVWPSVVHERSNGMPGLRCVPRRTRAANLNQSARIQPIHDKLWSRFHQVRKGWRTTTTTCSLVAPHLLLATNSEPWERGFERISSTNRTAAPPKNPSGLREDETPQHTQRCEILPRCTPLASDQATDKRTIAAISATFHVSAPSRTSSGMPRTKASCKGSTARARARRQPAVACAAGVYRRPPAWQWHADLDVQIHRSNISKGGWQLRCMQHVHLGAEAWLHLLRHAPGALCQPVAAQAAGLWYCAAQSGSTHHALDPLPRPRRPAIHPGEHDGATFEREPRGGLYSLVPRYPLQA